jgi:hypothetical protein
MVEDDGCWWENEFEKFEKFVVRKLEWKWERENLGRRIFVGGK